MIYNPGDIVPYIVHRQKDDDEAVAIPVKILTAAESIRVAKLRDDIIELGGASNEQGRAKLVEALAVGGVDMTDDLLNRIVLNELYELVNVLIYGPPITEEQKKTSA